MFTSYLFVLNVFVAVLSWTLHPSFLPIKLMSLLTLPFMYYYVVIDCIDDYECAQYVKANPRCDKCGFRMCVCDWEF